MAGFILFWFYDDESVTNSGKSSQKRSSRLQRNQTFFSVLGWNDTDFLSPSIIEDRFSSLKEVTDACSKAGLNTVRLIVAIDFSASNEWLGRRTFSSECLHRVNTMSYGGPVSSSSLSPPTGSLPNGGVIFNSWQLSGSNISACNPYQRVLITLAQTWEPFLDITRDGIWAYKFGDATTEDKRILSLRTDGSLCENFQELYTSYYDTARSPLLRMKGPTSFVPILERAIQMSHCRRPRKCFSDRSTTFDSNLLTENVGVTDGGVPTQSPCTCCNGGGGGPGVYTVLVILTDGYLNDDIKTEAMLIKASEHPISVVCVGVGDGPWTRMEELDDNIPERKFDNFQFVDYHRCTYKVKMPEVNLGLHIMMEIPDQYHNIKGLGYV